MLYYPKHDIIQQNHDSKELHMRVSANVSMHLRVAYESHETVSEFRLDRTGACQGARRLRSDRESSQESVAYVAGALAAREYAQTQSPRIRSLIDLMAAAFVFDVGGPG